MNKVLRVLNVEDSERDVTLIERHLSRAGYTLVSQRVDTAAAMMAALESAEWDIILSDYSMPRFNALQALAILKEAGRDIPFIIISGTIGEEVAVEAMLAGAQDYLMKDNLARLTPTIERELTEAQNRLARRHAEALVLESEDRYRDLVEHSHDLICTHDQEGRILSVNQATIKLTGYEQDVLLKKSIRDLLLPEFQHDFDDYLTALKEHGVARGTMAIQTVTGERRVLEYANTVRTEGVVDPIVRCMAHDVTEQRRADEILRTREQHFRSLIENSSDGITLVSMEGAILYASPSTPQLLGYTPEELVTFNQYELIHEDDRDSVTQSLTQALSQPRTGVSVRARVLHKDGSWRWLEGTFTNLLDEPSVGAIVNNYRDITERRESEGEMAWLDAEVESQRQRLNNIIASVPGVVWEAWGEPGSPNQNLGFIGDYVETMLGYSVEECLETPSFLLSIIHPNDREQTARAAALNFAKAESSSRLEFRCVAKDGHVIWVESNSAVITDDQGQPVGVRGVTIDITQRKHLEEQFRQSQKMEAVGRLAGGVAHDFNNLLTAIIGYSQLALARLRQEDPMRKDLEEIESAGQRAASLTSQLLAFSRRQVIQPQIVDLNEVVTKLSKMLNRLIGEDIELALALDNGIGRVKADPGQIEQIILNLGVNSRDAMPQGGKLTIETTNVQLDDSYSEGHIDARPGPHVMLAVSDTGVGMDKETASRIFEPFFTTKEEGKGTGLGLSTVYGIVKQSGGHIGVYSEPGGGTTFKIYFPRLEFTEEHFKPPASPSEWPTGTETILLIEDSEMVRNLARKMLEEAGYKVLEASGGTEADLVCEQYPDSIDLIVTDVVMPGTSGREVAGRLNALRPEVRVLFMSGYTDDAIIRHGVVDAEMPFLQKPFSREALLRKVREVLDGPRR